MRALAAVLVSTLALLGVMMLAQSLSTTTATTATTKATPGPMAGAIAPTGPVEDAGSRPHVWPAPDPRDAWGLPGTSKSESDRGERQSNRSIGGRRAPRDASHRPNDASYPPGADRLTSMLNGFDDWVARTKVRIARDESLRLKQAARLYDAGRYGQAADAYRAATNLDATDADAWTGLGMALTASGDYAAAADAYERAVKLRPDDAVAQFNLGVTYVRLDRGSDAIEAFRRAVIADPTHEKSLFNLATLTELDGRLAEARYWWEKLAALGGLTAVGAQASAGRVALRQGATADALELLGAAFLARPADPTIIRPLAIAIDAESPGDENISVDADAWRDWLIVIDPNGALAATPAEPSNEVAMNEEPASP